MLQAKWQETLKKNEEERISSGYGKWSAEFLKGDFSTINEKYLDFKKELLKGWTWEASNTQYFNYEYVRDQHMMDYDIALFLNKEIKLIGREPVSILNSQDSNNNATDEQMKHRLAWAATRILKRKHTLSNS